MSTGLLIIMVIVGVIILAIYVALIVRIWRGGYTSLPEAERGPATYRANLSGLVLYSTLVGVISLAAIVIGGMPIARLALSADWPTTTGEIVESSAEPFILLGRAGRITRWAANVSYTYEVGGEVYTNDDVTFREDETYNEQADAEAVTARYAPGDSVEVTYQPDAPQIAVLDRRVPAESYWIAVGGLFMMAIYLISMANRARLHRESAR